MECPDDKILNPYTKKCVKKCKTPEHERNSKFNCINPCKPGQERNEKTGKCKNIQTPLIPKRIKVYNYSVSSKSKSSPWKNHHDFLSDNHEYPHGWLHKKNSKEETVYKERPFKIISKTNTQNLPNSQPIPDFKTVSKKNINTNKKIYKFVKSKEMLNSSIKSIDFPEFNYPYNDDKNVLKTVKPNGTLFQKNKKTMAQHISSIKRPIKPPKTFIQKTIKSIKKTLGYKSSSAPSKFSFTNRKSRSIDRVKNYDAFDENKFKNEYNIFAIYFTGIEKLIRTFQWIKYKYEDNFKQNLIEELHAQHSYEDKKKYLETLTNNVDPFDFLTAWFHHFDPSQNTLKHINNLLNTNSDCFGILCNKLYKQYIDPNWKAVDLWIDDESCKDI